MAARHIGMAGSMMKPSFQIDSQVVGVLSGSGSATFITRAAEDLPMNRGTRIAHIDPDPSKPRRPSMTREEYIAEYCRRRGVAWADLSKYRVALPSSDAIGWTMINAACGEDEQTMQGPLEPLP